MHQRNALSENIPGVQGQYRIASANCSKDKSEIAVPIQRRRLKNEQNHDVSKIKA